MTKSALELLGLGSITHQHGFIDDLHGWVIFDRKTM
jgi:hypothetical protein